MGELANFKQLYLNNLLSHCHEIFHEYQETSLQGTMSSEFLISRPSLDYDSLCANWLDFGCHGNQSKISKTWRSAELL